jgi:hypothetical protein
MIRAGKVTLPWLGQNTRFVRQRLSFNQRILVMPSRNPGDASRHLQGGIRGTARSTGALAGNPASLSTAARALDAGT